MRKRAQQEKWPIRGCPILGSHEDAYAKRVTVLGAETSGTTGTGTALAHTLRDLTSLQSS